jgi:hypothetical protein
MNFLDRGVAAYNPVCAVQRAQARRVLSMHEGGKPGTLRTRFERLLSGKASDCFGSENETARAVGAPASACGSWEVRRAVPYVGE